MLLQSVRNKRIYMIILLTLLSGVVLSASDIPVRGWTIGPSVGVLWGTAYEIVYDTSGVPNSHKYLSLLIWELNPAVTIGFESVWESGKKTSLDLKLRTAVPGMPVGEMNDFDWLYTDMDWSHWSVSDVNLRWGVLFDAVYDWRIVNQDWFNLKFGVGYHLDWWAWRDTIKDSIYSTTNQANSYYPGPFPAGDGYRDTEMDPSNYGTNGINYDVAYHVPLVSLTVGMNFRTFFLNLNGRIGPVLAFSHDHHLLRTDFGPEGAHFYDSAAGGPWIDAFLATGFRSSGRFSFTIRGEYAWLNETRGDTIVVYTDGSPSAIARDSAGFSFRRIGVTTLFSWTLDPKPGTDAGS
jgi:outer membrane protease